MTTTKSLEVAREIVRSRGGVCLVPLPGKGVISSHEKTFCDCEVEEMIATALDQLKPRPSREEFEKWCYDLKAEREHPVLGIGAEDPEQCWPGLLEAYAYLTAHAMPEMCVETAPQSLMVNGLLQSQLRAERARSEKLASSIRGALSTGHTADFKLGVIEDCIAAYEAPKPLVQEIAEQFTESLKTARVKNDSEKLNAMAYDYTTEHCGDEHTREAFKAGFRARVKEQ